MGQQAAHRPLRHGKLRAEQSIHVEQPCCSPGSSSIDLRLPGQGAGNPHAERVTKKAEQKPQAPEGPTSPRESDHRARVPQQRQEAHQIGEATRVRDDTEVLEKVLGDEEEVRFDRRQV